MPRSGQSVVYCIVWLHSYSCPDLLGFCATHAQHMLSSMLLSFSPSPRFLSSCNCKCTPNFLRLVCPCLCHEHTQYSLHGGLGKFGKRSCHLSEVRTTAMLLNEGDSLVDFCLSQLIKKLNSTKRGASFRHFCVSKVTTDAHVHKSGVIFQFFEDLSNKKN